MWMVPAVAVALLAGAAPAAAQASCSANPCTVAVVASATVTEILSLTLSSATTNLGNPVEADFDAGFLDAAGPTATVKANSPWHVDVVGAAANFGYTGTYANPGKSAGDLLWGIAAGAYGNNMGAAGALFSGSGTAGTNQAIFFRTLWSWASDVPGAYDLTINFTLAAP
jgi:hypothetical protein